MKDDLGYSKYDYRNNETENSSNGTYMKTVNSSQGEIELEVPRDRNGEYELCMLIRNGPKKHEIIVKKSSDCAGTLHLFVGNRTNLSMKQKSYVTLLDRFFIIIPGPFFARQKQVLLN